LTVEFRAYKEVMGIVEFKSLTNYWKAPCTFTKPPKDFENHEPSL